MREKQRRMKRLQQKWPKQHFLWTFSYSVCCAAFSGIAPEVAFFLCYTTKSVGPRALLYLSEVVWHSKMNRHSSLMFMMFFVCSFLLPISFAHVLLYQKVDVHCSDTFKRLFRSLLTFCLSHPLTAPPADLRMLLSWQQPQMGEGFGSANFWISGSTWLVDHRFLFVSLCSSPSSISSFWLTVVLTLCFAAEPRYSSARLFKNYWWTLCTSSISSTSFMLTPSRDKCCCPRPQKLRICVDVAKAMQYLHELLSKWELRSVKKKPWMKLFARLTHGICFCRKTFGIIGCLRKTLGKIGCLWSSPNVLGRGQNYQTKLLRCNCPQPKYAIL